MVHEFFPSWSASPRRLARRNVLGLTALLTFVASAAPVGAQNSGKGFLFKRPAGSFSLRGGYALANAGSGVFDDAVTQLTLDKRDFSSWAFGGDISYAPTPRLDLVFDGQVSIASRNSEFREFIDNNDKPIEQATKFSRIPLTVDLKYYVTDRGREVSQFAYIPSRYATYIGVGAGAMYYRFKQNGDFIDFDTDNLEVFSTSIEDSGWTPTVNGLAGFDYSLGPWLALSFEGRYQWARAQLDPDTFVGYDKIDLSGFTGTVGFRVRF